MRRARIKVKPEVEESVYHCMTRVVNGERVLDEVAREVLRAQLWQVADYCGVEILTYAVLSNHFHVLVKVPLRTMPADEELLRRYRVLYPKPTKYQTARLEVIAEQLKKNDAEGQAWRQRQVKLMGDVSTFMKLVKQRFSIWFNKSHRRYGTLWAERFKSVLIEPKNHAIETVALYIDLNCVRAGLATDPKDYRFCGYAEAVGGSAVARRGILGIFGSKLTWDDAQARYREALFGAGVTEDEDRAAITPEAFAEVLRQKGQLPLATVLRCRIRYFTDGAVLGSHAFVATHLADYRRRHGARQSTPPRPLSAITDWRGLTSLRGLRTNPFG